MDKELMMLLLFVAALLFGGYWYDKESCMTKAISFDGVKYSIVGGCMVKHKGRWLPLENIRGFDGS